MDALYSVMQGLESRLGGGEGVEGIYGSITATGMHKVLECMKHNCGLGKNSTLIDIGAGLGRPLLHALLLHGVAHGYGVELDHVKVSKAQAFCKGVIDELALRGVLNSTGGGNGIGGSGGAGSNSNRPVSSSRNDTAPAAADAAGPDDAKQASIDAGAAKLDIGVGGDVVLPALSQGSCLGSQDCPAPAAAAAAAGGVAAAAAGCGGGGGGAAAGGCDDSADDTLTQVDCSQAVSDAAADGGLHTTAAAITTQKQQQQQPGPTAAAAAASAGGAPKVAGGKAKGGALLWPASRPIITCAAIEQIASLDPGTHAYSFWEGVPLCGKQAFGRLFRTSKTLKAVAVVQRAMRGQAPEAVMAELGFGPLLLIKAFPVSMSGSGRSFTAYVFSKLAPPSAMLLMRRATTATTSAAAAAAGTDAAAGDVQQQQQQQDSMPDALVSCTKPKKAGSRCDLDAAAAAGVAARIESAGADESSPDQEQQQQQQEQLIQLLTEESLAAVQQQQQQQPGCSPAKRPQPFLLAAAAADADADGSPSKKQKGVDGSNQLGAAAGLGRSGSGLYGLRPRQLSYSYSNNSSRSSGGTSSRARSAAGTSSTTTAPRQGAAGNDGGAGRRAGLRSSSSSSSLNASRASSMSVDQPVGGGRGGGSSSRGKGTATRSTAASSKSRTAKQQQQNVSAAVSDARAAVAALDV